MVRLQKKGTPFLQLTNTGYGVKYFESIHQVIIVRMVNTVSLPTIHSLEKIQRNSYLKFILQDSEIQIGSIGQSQGKCFRPISGMEILKHCTKLSLVQTRVGHIVKAISKSEQAGI